MSFDGVECHGSALMVLVSIAQLVGFVDRVGCGIVLVSINKWMVEMKNGDMPAMPIELNGFGLYEPCAYLGLTKREQFAMAAMHGILANDSANLINPEIQDIVSRLSVLCADALLAELERTK